MHFATHAFHTPWRKRSGILLSEVARDGAAIMGGITPADLATARIEADLVLERVDSASGERIEGEGYVGCRI